MLCGQRMEMWEVLGMQTMSCVLWSRILASEFGGLEIVRHLPKHPYNLAFMSARVTPEIFSSKCYTPPA